MKRNCIIYNSSCTVHVTQKFPRRPCQVLKIMEKTKPQTFPSFFETSELTIFAQYEEPRTFTLNLCFSTVLSHGTFDAFYLFDALQH